MFHYKLHKPNNEGFELSFLDGDGEDFKNSNSSILNEIANTIDNFIPPLSLNEPPKLLAFLNPCEDLNVLSKVSYHTPDKFNRSLNAIDFYLTYNNTDSMYQYFGTPIQDITLNTMFYTILGFIFESFFNGNVIPIFYTSRLNEASFFKLVYMLKSNIPTLIRKSLNIIFFRNYITFSRDRNILITDNKSVFNLTDDYIIDLDNQNLDSFKIYLPFLSYCKDGNSNAFDKIFNGSMITFILALSTLSDGINMLDFISEQNLDTLLNGMVDNIDIPMGSIEILITSINRGIFNSKLQLTDDRIKKIYLSLINHNIEVSKQYIELLSNLIAYDDDNISINRLIAFEFSKEVEYQIYLCIVNGIQFNVSFEGISYSDALEILKNHKDIVNDNYQFKILFTESIYQEFLNGMVDTSTLIEFSNFIIKKSINVDTFESDLDTFLKFYNIEKSCSLNDFNAFYDNLNIDDTFIRKVNSIYSEVSNRLIHDFSISNVFYYNLGIALIGIQDYSKVTLSTNDFIRISLEDFKSLFELFDTFGLEVHKLLDYNSQILSIYQTYDYFFHNSNFDNSLDYGKYPAIFFYLNLITYEQYLKYLNGFKDSKSYENQLYLWFNSIFEYERDILKVIEFLDNSNLDICKQTKKLIFNNNFLRINIFGKRK